ncbi:DNA methyltransferase [Sorangium sp. So ce124]|uniref:DNA methyltransferase n=1 Tax=Sorangium sp. So ce124 TaxID=3133280 RepID=UPI003F617C0E
MEFGSNWQVSTRKRDVKDGKSDDLVRQPEQIKAFRDTWELGIHSYLSYMRDRLYAAHELLTNSGSIFVQISTENLDYMALLLDEIFGHDNRVELISFRKKTMPLGGSLLEGNCDYLLWYAKSKSEVKYRALYQESVIEGDSHWNYVELAGGERVQMSADQIANHGKLPTGSSVYQLIGMYPTGTFATGIYDFEHEGVLYKLPNGKCWKTPIVGMQRLAVANRLQPYASGATLRYVLKHSDYPVTPLQNVWQDTSAPSDKVYVVQTSNLVVQRCMLMTTDPGDLVLDPTCGSGTTAAVAEQWGRRWITTDTSRISLAVARTRLMVSKYHYYLLVDSPEGIRKTCEISGSATTLEGHGDIRQGFVYQKVPHVTLKSIANNDEVDTIHARFGAQLAPLRTKLNKLLKKKWEEWEIHRDADASWPAEAKAAHAEWWQLRRARQKEIDASIARRAESEILYDQPYEDPKRIRVSGPFTVESLSPHRMLDASIPVPKSQTAGANASTFITTILDNLKKAGVQNTVKNERLLFDRLNPFPGKWIQAEGEFTHKSGAIRRAAISIGPEHGTVSPEQVRGAAKEALKHSTSPSSAASPSMPSPTRPPGSSPRRTEATRLPRRRAAPRRSRSRSCSPA